MTAFVAEQRDTYRVEPICRVPEIAPSTYYSHAARAADPAVNRYRISGGSNS